MDECKISRVVHAILHLELDVHVAAAAAASMHHCKTCGSPVCDSRERRLLDTPTSASVRQELNNFVGTLGESFSRFNDEHFSDGYLCKKCFMLVVKRNRIKSELDKVDTTIKSNMSTAASVFGFHDLQGQVRGSKRRNRPSQGSTPKRMRTDNESRASVVVCYVCMMRLSHMHGMYIHKSKPLTI